MSRSVFPHKAIQPCLPKPAKEPPAGPDWIHEIKHDGFRILARRNATGVWLYTRNGSNFADRFPRIVEAVESLPVQSCFIDGEAIVVDGNGLSVFDLLRSWRHNRAAVVCAFDVIELDGENLRRTQIEQRKRALANLLSREHEDIAFNRHYDGDGTVIYKHACALGCEGIVSKRLSSTYRSGRVNDWLKIKNPAAPAAKREAEEDWGNKRWGHGRLRG
jgi:ATP-dependent DNA ligase